MYTRILIATGGSPWSDAAAAYAIAVAAKAQCPVLVIKQPPLAPLCWRRVLVATGGSPWSDAAVDHALELARVQQLELCLLYVDQRRSRRMDSLFSLTSDGKNVLALAEARAAAAGVPYEAKLAQGDVTTTILATATEQQCDVI